MVKMVSGDLDDDHHDESESERKVKVKGPLGWSTVVKMDSGDLDDHHNGESGQRVL